MSTPRFRHWKRFFIPKMVSGLLVGMGLLILVVTQLMVGRSSMIAFVAGVACTLLGLVGLATFRTPAPR